MTTPATSYRVVQWTTGNVGRCAVRMLAEAPHLELVGLFAHSADKVGRDAGDLVGISPLGVTATDDIDALLALRPDAILYMPLFPDYDHVERFLAAGVNVVTTSAFINGTHLGAERRDRLEAAAHRGGVTLFGTGTNPGLANVLGLLATQVCRRVDAITVLESVDATFYASVQTWERTGFGLAHDDPKAVELARTNSLTFQDAVAMMADALGFDLDDIVFEAQFAAATERVELGWWTIEKGCNTGLKGSWNGIKDGKTVISLQLVWKLGYTMEPDWPLAEGYVVTVKGEPDVTATLHPGFHPGWEMADYNYVISSPAVHAIPAIVAAAPGIANAPDLPLVAARRYPS